VSWPFENADRPGRSRSEVGAPCNASAVTQNRPVVVTSKPAS
jgi:hypothetical protein